MNGQEVVMEPVSNDKKLKYTRAQAIKIFFDPVRKVENKEIMELSQDERKELGDLCLVQLGAELMELQA